MVSFWRAPSGVPRLARDALLYCSQVADAVWIDHGLELASKKADRELRCAVYHSLGCLHERGQAFCGYSDEGPAFLLDPKVTRDLVKMFDLDLYSLRRFAQENVGILRKARRQR